MYGATNIDGIWFAVYHPPKEGLPFLSVMGLPDGTTSSGSFPTLEEAEDFTTGLIKKANP